jgi:hypothetical protein
MLAVLALLQLSCAPTAPDAVRYQDILSDTSLPTSEGLRGCAALQATPLRGDCALAVATRSDAPAAACPSVPSGLWQEECWFVAAEATNRRGDVTGAAELCGRAGRFRLDCAQHLWQTPVHRLIHTAGAAGFATALPEAEALYSAWAPVVGEDTDFSDRFWAKFFGNGFEGQGLPITARWCEPLPPQRRAGCETAAAAHLSRELGPAVEQPGRLLAFCALHQPGIEEVAGWIEAEPSAVLDRAVAGRQLDICLNAPGAPGRVGP